MFNKEHFYNKCASKEFALELDPPETCRERRASQTIHFGTRKASPNYARVMKQQQKKLILEMDSQAQQSTESIADKSKSL